MKYCMKNCKMNHKCKMNPKMKKKAKIKKVMKEFEEDKLHSGSKKGPLVKKRDQAVAIALSESRKMKHKK